jgi:hypothetical protein
MANFKVNNVPSWVRYTATDMQTEFAIPFPFINNSDLSVWQNGVLLVLTTDYTLAGEQTTSGGTLTLNVGASLNDMIVIQDLMVIDRTSIYTPTISALTGSQLNEDFNRDVIMIRDTTTTVNYLMLQYAPYALISQDIDVTVDRLIPILPPLSTWQKNADNTAIIAVSLPTSVVGVDGSFTDGNRLTSTNLIPGNNYIQQTDLQVIGDTLTSISSNLILTGTNDVRAVTNGNVILSPGGYVSIDGALWPTSGAAAGKAPVFVNSTQLVFDYVANATALQDNTYIYADDTGTTNTFEIALNPPLASYVEGQTVYFKAANPNTGASTLNVNGLGAVALYKNYNAQLANADILAGQIVQATYDGATFQLDSPVANMTDGGGVNPGTIYQAAYYASSGNVVSGSPALLLTHKASGVNYLSLTDNTTGSAPSISALGSDTDVGLYLYSKGAGEVSLTQDNGTPIVFGQPVANSVNYVLIENASSGNSPIVSVDGSDTNINMVLMAKGNGSVYVRDGANNIAFAAGPGAVSAVNYLGASNNDTGMAPYLESFGSDTNISMAFKTKGTGYYVFFDGNNNAILNLNSVASAVNAANIINSATGTPVSIETTGTDTNIALQIKGKGTGGVAIQGSTAASLPATGYVGEIITHNVPSASAVSCAASGSAKDMASIPLTAGNWNVTGNIFFDTTSSGAANTIGKGWLSLTSATAPDNSMTENGFSAAASGANIGIGVPDLTVSVSGTTTVYITGLASYGAGTPTMCGNITATRLP